MGIKISVITILVMLLFVGIVSANWEWDNIKNYDEEIKTITITNALGLGSDISTIRLDSAQNVYVIRGNDRMVAEFTIDNYDHYLNVFNDMEFYDIKNSMNKFDREFVYKYEKSLGLFDVNDYETICMDSKELYNGTPIQECHKELIGTHQEERFEWVELDILKELSKGEITIGIFTNVLPNENVEWIPTLFGVKIEEWSEWTESLNTDLDLYYNFTSSLEAITGTYNLEVLTGAGCSYTITNALIGKSGRFTSGNNNKILTTPLTNLTEDSTLNFWGRVDSIGGTEYFISMDYGGTNTLICSHLNDFYAALIVSGVSSVALMENNTWQMFTLIHNGTSGSIYMNATLMTTGTWGNSISRSNVSIGGNLGGSQELTGLMDEMGWWSRALSQAELTQLYNNSFGLTYVSADTTSPVITSFSPTNTSYNYSTIYFNATADETIDMWVMNYNGTNITGFTINSTLEVEDGNNFHLLVYGNDSSSNLGLNDSIYFSVDTVTPTITSFSPTNSSYNYSTIYFNATATESIDTWVINYNGTNITDFSINSTLTVEDGHNFHLFIYGNDSAGNLNVNNTIYFSVDATVPIITSFSPKNTSYTTSTIYFNASGNETIDTWVVNYNGTNITNFNINNSLSVEDGSDFYLLIYGNDSFGNFGVNNTIYFSVDTILPMVNITTPTATINYHLINTNLTLNWTATDDHIDSCWYDYNGTNVTVTCNVNTTYLNITNASNSDVRFWGNDTFGNYNSSYVDWSYIIFENLPTYNSTSFETKTEGFTVNITTNGSVPTTGELIYNGTTYTSATITNTAGNYYDISKTIDIPITTGNKSFHFNFTLAGTVYSTTSRNQTISLINFSICSGTVTQEYLNFSFKDEEADTYMNATIDTSTWNYWLGTGTVNKSYIYSTNTNHYNYSFCSSAKNDSIKLDMSVQYSNTDYPQRKYENASTYINSSVMNTILYLLSSADGLSVTFQVLSGASQPISGVSVIGTRVISGASVVVASGTTGADGGVTFWLNPDYTHILTFSKTGYDTETLTITPTQSIYTVTLGGEEIETTTEDYSRGISYSIKPAELNLNYNTTYWFNFTISSNYWDLNEFGITITNGTITYGTDSGTTGTGGTASVSLDTNSNTTIKMHWYYDIDGNITRGTKSWWVANFTDKGYGISTFFTDLKSYTGTAGSTGIFGLNDFSRTLLIFIFIFVVVGMVSYMVGVYSPAAIIWLVFVLVALFDVGGDMLPSPGIPHFPTLLTLLVAVGLTLREGMK